MKPFVACSERAGNIVRSVSAGQGRGSGSFKRIALVGNAPFTQDLSERIDAADIVVRFNNAFGYGKTRGSRIDDLFLVNCGGQPFEWLRSSEFWQRDYLRRASQIILPFPAETSCRQLPHIGSAPTRSMDGINFEHDLRYALTQIGKPVATLPAARNAAAIAALRKHGAASEPVIPSTGFLAVHSYLETHADDVVLDLHGFGFDGWQGHDWTSERRWIAAREAEGRLNWWRAS